jgi:hypothetical protein
VLALSEEVIQLRAEVRQMHGALHEVMQWVLPEKSARKPPALAVGMKRRSRPDFASRTNVRYTDVVEA